MAASVGAALLSPNITVVVAAAADAVTDDDCDADAGDNDEDGDDKNEDEDDDDIDGDREAAACKAGGDGAGNNLFMLFARLASVSMPDLRRKAANAADEDAAPAGDRGDVGEILLLPSVDATEMSSGGGRCGPVSSAMRRVSNRAARIAVSISHRRRARTRTAWIARP